MHGNISTSSAAAAVAALANESERITHFSEPVLLSDPSLASENDDWFAEAAWTICGKDAGYQLHLFTGWPQSSCYSFVARDAGKRRKPPVAFLRLLFRSPHGGPFFNAFMAECVAPWFNELRHARHRAEIAEAKLRDIMAIANG